MQKKRYKHSALNNTHTGQDHLAKMSLIRFTGKVKWFNNKAGFGFVTACEGEFKDKDIFAHYSAIKVPIDQYKYLVQGEYVDFDLSKSEKGEHEYHAVNISGVKGGSLMCETRFQNQEKRYYKPRVYKTPDDVPRKGEETETTEGEFVKVLKRGKTIVKTTATKPKPDSNS